MTKLNFIMQEMMLEKRGFYVSLDLLTGEKIMRGEHDFLIYEFRHEKDDYYRFWRYYIEGDVKNAVYTKDLFSGSGDRDRLYRRKGDVKG